MRELETEWLEEAGFKREIDHKFFLSATKGEYTIESFGRRGDGTYRIFWEPKYGILRDKITMFIGLIRTKEELIILLDQIQI